VYNNQLHFSDVGKRAALGVGDKKTSVLTKNNILVEAKRKFPTVPLIHKVN
jgi:hypothetical protein